MSFIKKRKRIQFESAFIEESTSYLPNPSCGWYRIYPFAIEEKQDFGELFWCLRAEEHIVLALIDIGAFRDAEISKEALINLADIFDFFGKHEKEMILRITYDREGRGMEHEPQFLKTVIGHMQQLGEVIRGYPEQILVVQGVLIGSWGEMHDSKFLSDERLKQLMDAWREALGDEIAIAVRTPQQWRILHSAGACVDKTGLFNDGMFGSADDLGTYGWQEKEEAGWDEKWRREEEINFIRDLANVIPYGGEAVDGSVELSFAEIVEEMRHAGVSYLNSTHDEKRLGQWKEALWKEPGVWGQKSVFDYIGCRLGYRFVVRKAEPVGKKEILLKISIENIGFSTLKEEAELLLYIEDTKSVQECYILPDSLCGILPQKSAEILVRLPEKTTASKYELSLALRRKRDKQPMFFANKCMDNGSVKLGAYQVG